jgi:hypothetical protein
MLVDGETKQLGALKTEGKKLGMTMQIVLDLLHVLHYVYVTAAPRGVLSRVRSRPHLPRHDSSRASVPLG